MTNEKRLIDANALEDDLKCKPIRFLTDKYMMRELIKDAPTVDAVEVVHSQWDTVFYERNGTLGSYSHICPECKYIYRDVRFKGHNYCPNCGAKMDGDGNG